MINNSNDILKEMILTLNAKNILSDNLTPALLKNISKNIEVMEFILTNTNLSQSLTQTLLRMRREKLDLSPYLNFKFEKQLIIDKLNMPNYEGSVVKYIFEEIPTEVVLKDIHWIVEVLKSPNMAVNFLSNSLFLELQKTPYFEKTLKENEQGLSKSKLNINFESAELNWALVDSKISNYYTLTLENRTNSYVLNNILEKIEKIHAQNDWHSHISSFMKIKFQLKLINFISTSIEEAEVHKQSFSHPEEYKSLTRDNYKEAIISIGGSFKESMSVEDYVRVIKRRMNIFKDFELADFKNKPMYDLMVENMSPEKICTLEVLFEIVSQYNKAVTIYQDDEEFVIHVNIVKNIKKNLDKLPSCYKSSVQGFIKKWVSSKASYNGDSGYLKESASATFNHHMVQLETVLLDLLLSKEIPVNKKSVNSINKF